MDDVVGENGCLVWACLWLDYRMGVVGAVDGDGMGLEGLNIIQFEVDFGEFVACDFCGHVVGKDLFPPYVI